MAGNLRENNSGGKADIRINMTDGFHWLNKQLDFAMYILTRDCIYFTVCPRWSPIVKVYHKMVYIYINTG